MHFPDGQDKSSIQFAEELSDCFSDIVVLTPETAKTIFSDARLELIRAIDEEEGKCVSGLARKLNRDGRTVRRDLKRLFEAGIIDYERNGAKKIPVLRHEHIIVKPPTYGE